MPLPQAPAILYTEKVTVESTYQFSWIATPAEPALDPIRGWGWGSLGVYGFPLSPGTCLVSIAGAATRTRLNT